MVSSAFTSGRSSESSRKSSWGRGWMPFTEPPASRARSLPVPSTALVPGEGKRRARARSAPTRACRRRHHDHRMRPREPWRSALVVSAIEGRLRWVGPLGPLCSGASHHAKGSMSPVWASAPPCSYRARTWTSGPASPSRGFSFAPSIPRNGPDPWLRANSHRRSVDRLWRGTSQRGREGTAAADAVWLLPPLALRPPVEPLHPHLRAKRPTDLVGAISGPVTGGDQGPVPG